MSSSDRLLLILHIGFAIFTLGPLTAATMSTPRYIRRRNVPVLRYLHRTTQLYALLSLGIFLFGIFLAKGKFSQVWLTASMTLFIVALGLLLIVSRDQGKAVQALQLAATESQDASPVRQREPETPGTPTAPTSPGAPVPDDSEGPHVHQAPEPRAQPAKPVAEEKIAEVERGRIAALSGVIALLWIVILVLMVWYGSS